MRRRSDIPRSPDGGAGAAPWHGLAATAVAGLLATEWPGGLSDREAASRLRQTGSNILRERRRATLPQMLLRQFADFMIILLIAAAAVSGIVGDVEDAVVILVIVLLNAVIGVLQEWRAEQAMAALAKLAPAMAVVVRERRSLSVRTQDIVPGDIVLLESGGAVPADLRLAETHQLRIGEATLTGESVPADKDAAPLDIAAPPLGDRTNMAFKGTTVTHGRGLGIVVATGMSTELGKLAGLLDAGIAAATPLQRRLAQFGRRLALVIIAICAIIFAVGLARGEPVVLMFLTAVSLAVAAIPEALPATLTIALALGARKMAGQKALVRRLPAVETLGSVTWICTDKTGTLTLNRMTVEQVLAGDLSRWQPGAGSGDEPWSSLFAAMALNNDARRGDDGGPLGDPMEVALDRAAADAGVASGSLRARLPRLAEIPFDSARKRMTTFHPAGAALVGYTKGAPESVVDRCVDALAAGGRRPIDRAAVLAGAEAMAAGGLRVLAVAQRRWDDLPPAPIGPDAERDLTLLGLVGLIDPPRPEAAGAVAACRSAGIVPVMITGDHPATALAIARRLGIAGEDAAALSGTALADLSDEALAARVGETRVYARTDPAQKIRIVAALQRRGEVVAMTGDGVNDAPALGRADIGVAMGQSGTDVAREAASLVLLDDNFATIVAAVREGRRIHDNIRKVIRYIMTGNVAEIWTIFLAPFLGLPIPLLPIHILWINLVTDGLPALALAAEPAEGGIMARPPRPPGQSIFAGALWWRVAWLGLLIAGVSLLAQAYAIRTGSPHGQTMVFTVLTAAQLLQALAIRSERDPAFGRGLPANLPLAGTILVTLVLQLATIYLPVLNRFFRTAPLTADELAVCVLLSMTAFAAIEIEKWRLRRRRTAPSTQPRR